MRKLFSIFIILTFVIIHSHNVGAVCTGGNNAGAINPEGNWQTINVNTYTYYTFVAGYETEVFVFSFCQAGGASLVDTQIEIHDNTGTPTGFYNNDHCGLGSEVVFSAPSAGIYRVSIYEFNCNTSTISAGTLAYKRLPTPTIADCLGALPLCNVINSHPVSSTGEGNYYDLFDFNAQFGMGVPTNNCPNCLVTGELNSMWYTFTVSQSGLLGFTINPNASADYDWSLHNISSNTCADLIDYTSNPPVSCNYCEGSGATGMSSTGSGACHGPSGCGQFNDRIWVNEGEVYVLHITNFSANTAGYSIDFSNSTASIVDNVPPDLLQIVYAPYCGSSSVTIQFSEAIWCTGVDADAFELSGPGGNYDISEVWSALCVAGDNSTYDGTFYDDVWTIELNDFMTQSGEYTLTLLSGGVDDICENPANQTSLVFTIIGIDADVNILSLSGCPGESIGEIAVTNITGGTAPYYVEWNGPGGFYSEDAHIQNLEPGSYELRITDDEGICEYLEVIELTEVPPLELNFIGDTSYCEGQTIDILVTSSADPLATYQWSGPNSFTSNNQNIVIPSATPANSGSYSLTVTDDYGCTLGLSGNINVIPQVPVTASSDGPYCTGAIINLFASDVPGGTYEWTGPNGFVANEQNPNISNAQTMHTGTYNVVVSYADNCTSSASVDVLVSPDVEFTLTGVDILCNGDCTGQITASVTAGTAPFNYEWSDASTTNPAIGLCADILYCVTVTDAIGCFAEACHTLSQPSEITATISTTPAECGINDGTAEIVVGGGSGGHVIMWSTGHMGNLVTDLPPGEYCATVTDSNNCILVVCEIVDFYGAGEVEIQQLQEILCYGQTTAVLSTTMTDGTPPFTYEWSVPDENNATLSNIGAGTYSVTVTDLYGCTGGEQHTITQPPQMILSTQTTDVLCHGGSGGTAQASVSGGIPSYTYAWETGQNTSAISDLSAGTYGITVTDSNNCSSNSFAIVHEPINPVGFSLITNNVTCYNRFDGYAIALGTGGTPPYSVHWYQFGQLMATGEEISTLAAGTYMVRIQDDNNCNASGEFSIIEPTELIINSIVESVTCKGNSDGSILLTIDGGTHPYDILWNTGDTTTSLTSIGGGQYSVTITDQSYCQKNVGVYVPESSQLCLFIPDAFTPNGDGINDTWEIGYIEKYPDAIINVFNRWGQHIYQARGNDDFWDATWDGKFVPAGTYVYVIDLRNGMETFSGTVTVIY
jgi:gliding motility-associated-like protein